MNTEIGVIQPEPNAWDQKVPCCFKNLTCPRAREIIHKNLTHYLGLKNFDELVKTTNETGVYPFECIRDEANSIRDNLHLILTSSYPNIWLTISTYPLHKLHEHLLSDRNVNQHRRANVLFSFGSTHSTSLFHNHTKQFRHTGTVKVWKEGPRAKSIILDIKTLNNRITVPIQCIQKTILVNRGHDDQPIQIILMLNSAVKIDQKDSFNNACYRLGNDDIPNSFIDIISKSSDLLLQFNPPANAWLFLNSLPIIGHTNKNQRQDGNFEINFALFASEESCNNDCIIKHSLNSFKSQYSIEMLQSLGYVFTDKYIKLQSNSQKLLAEIERKSTKDFYDLCSLIYKALNDNHCLCLDDIITSHTTKQNKTDSTVINMMPLNDRFVDVRSLALTPMRVILKPLHREAGNRALRLRGAENYIRVYIRDENDQVLDGLDDNLRARFKLKMLTKGIKCMNKTYLCVGSSTSQTKDFSYWFTTLNHGETIDQIRARFGDFTKIKNMATYIARVGQYFSTSTATGIHLNYIDTSAIQISIPELTETESFLSLRGLWARLQLWINNTTTTATTGPQKYSVFIIKDIKEKDYCFTDGCGLISLGLAHEVAEKIGLSVQPLSDIPSVFQIRMGGCKGTLMIDPESTDADHYIKVRDSMVKFPSHDWSLDICAHSRLMPLRLNNQIIRLLSDLGNTNATFEALQSRNSKSVLWYEDAYLNVLDSELHRDRQSDFLNMKENLLQNKIPMPINEARNMFGVADVTGILKYGQCFIQYEIGPTETKRRYKVVEGTVIVTKNPCLYPGDIRKLQAVDVPPLTHCMRNCIVFPTTGPRPHSDEISGSDLDGDQYWVYWGNDFKIKEPVAPLEHSSANKSIVSNITNEMVIDHFLDGISANCYSLIADIHTVVADQEEEGTLSPSCIQLATLFYRAIDSPKTGEIIDMDFVSKLREKYSKVPKFMMKFDRPFYESTSILEKLYLNAKRMRLKTNDRYANNRQTFVSPIRKPSPTTVVSKSEPEHVQPSYFLPQLSSLLSNIFRFAT